MTRAAATPAPGLGRLPFVLLALAAWLFASAASAQRLSGAELVEALAQGGYVLVIRNARSPEEAPAENDRAPANLDGEREIDEHGQGQMAVIGYAFRTLGIPVDRTLSSPAYRSKQSAYYFGFGKQTTEDRLAEDADGTWLAARVAEAPSPGHNTVIVTHGAQIAQAFGRDARNVDLAETLIFRPSDGRAALVARLTVADWAGLAVD